MNNTENQVEKGFVAYVEFAIDGPLRFLSHQELLDLFIRAMTRASLPVVYSKGFNPHPKVSLPTPRSVGMSCSHDLLRFETTEMVDDAELESRLGGQLPAEVTIHSVWSTPVTTFPQPAEVEWEIDVPDDVDTSALTSRCKELMGTENAYIARTSHKTGRKRQIDLRGFILDTTFAEGRLSVRLSVSPAGSLRPAELLDYLGLPIELCMTRIARTRIRWQDQRFMKLLDRVS